MLYFQVAYYRIFCRTASGSNIKVRGSDYFLPGTGEQVPVLNCKLRVSGNSLFVHTNKKNKLPL